MLNSIYNSSYYGSQLWNLSSPEVMKVENSYNVSIRKMLGLPFTTHRYLIAPLSESIHLRQVLASRILGFCQRIENCKKICVKNIYVKVYDNAKSPTGSNLLDIAFLLNKQVYQLTPSDALGIPYCEISDHEQYRVDMIWELLNIRHGVSTLENFNNDEIGDILEHLCTS